MYVNQCTIYIYSSEISHYRIWHVKRCLIWSKQDLRALRHIEPWQNSAVDSCYQWTIYTRECVVNEHMHLVTGCMARSAITTCFIGHTHLWCYIQPPPPHVLMYWTVTGLGMCVHVILSHTVRLGDGIRHLHSCCYGYWSVGNTLIGETAYWSRCGCKCMWESAKA